MDLKLFFGLWRWRCDRCVFVLTLLVSAWTALDVADRRLKDKTSPAKIRERVRGLSFLDFGVRCHRGDVSKGREERWSPLAGGRQGAEIMQTEKGKITTGRIRLDGLLCCMNEELTVLPYCPEPASPTSMFPPERCG